MDMSWVAMPEWKAPTFLASPDEDARGKIDSHEIESKLVEENNKIGLDVYLPAGYEHTKATYPVAYVWGGDQAMAAGQMRRALDNITNKSINPTIVVFMKMQGRVPPPVQSQIFGEEIIPYIDEHFETSRNREARACVGAGFAGFAAVASAFANSELVGKVATTSMFMFGSMENGLQPFIKNGKDQPIELYLEWGKYDLRNPDEAWDLAQTNRDFVASLKDRGFAVRGVELHDGTGWSSWKNRTEALFTSLFPKG